MFFQQTYLDEAEREFDKTIEILDESRGSTDSDIKEFGYDLGPYWWKIKNKYDYAKRLYVNGLINEAEKTFKEAIEIFEDNKGKIEEAFRKGSTLPFTGMAQVYYDLGLLYVNIHDLEMAETKFQEAIRILPEDPELHIALGNINFSNEDYKEAIKEYDHALRQDPSHPVALLNRTVAAQNLSGKVGEKDGKDKKTA